MQPVRRSGRATQEIPGIVRGDRYRGGMRIEAKIAGQRRELFTPYELEWPVAKELTLRELIESVVRSEVDAFHTRQRERQLDRVLSPQQIELDRHTGKVDPGGQAGTGIVDAEQAVTTALEAFADGLFFLFVDGRQIDDLDAAVHVVPTSTLLFVRLTPLAGG